MGDWLNGGLYTGVRFYCRNVGKSKMWTFRTQDPEILYMVRQSSGLLRIKSGSTILCTSRSKNLYKVLAEMLEFEKWLSRNVKELAR